MNLLQESFDAQKPVEGLEKPAQESLLQDVNDTRDAMRPSDDQAKLAVDQSQSSIEFVSNPDTGAEAYTVTYSGDNVSRVDGIAGGQSIVRQQDRSYSLVQNEGARAGTSERLSDFNINSEAMNWITEAGGSGSYNNRGLYEELAPGAKRAAS